MEQMTFFDLTRKPFKIDKPIRLIELFAGVGSQAMALRDLGADFEHWRVVEFDPIAVKAYNAIHGTDFEPIDITKFNGGAWVYKTPRTIVTSSLTLSLAKT